MFNTEFSIRLKPHGSASPVIRFGIDTTEEKLILDAETELQFTRELASGDHKFIIELINKTNSTPDMAVEIVSITFEGMTFDRFKWANKFYPAYPKSYIEKNPNLLSEIDEVTLIGNAGRWELLFTAPIFKWIHQTEHLGWIYD